MKDKTKTVKTSMKGSRLWGIFLLLLLIIIDQATKLVADLYFSAAGTPDRIVLIEGWLSLCITYNRGISYGLGADASPLIKIGVIAATAVLMLVFFILYLKMDKRRSFLRIALIFIVAGGLGNLIDRTYYQVWVEGMPYGVRDMVDLTRFGFAVCNFADFFIVGGAVAFVAALIFFDRDAMIPLGKYKALAKEADEKAEAKKQAKREAKAAKKANKGKK